MQTKKVRVNGKPMNSKDGNEVIGLGKSSEVSNSPWECRVSKGMRKPKGSKRAKDAQEKKQKEHRSP